MHDSQLSVRTQQISTHYSIQSSKTAMDLSHVRILIAVFGYIKLDFSLNNFDEMLY